MLMMDSARGVTVPENTTEEKELSRVYKRFYLALQLRDLCNEMPIHVVARKYDAPRGSVQTLSQTCHGFAAGVIKFCQHMDWGYASHELHCNELLTKIARLMAAALDHFSDRLLAGARTELLSLTKIPFIKSRTAYVSKHPFLGLTLTTAGAYSGRMDSAPSAPLPTLIPKSWCLY